MDDELRETLKRMEERQRALAQAQRELAQEVDSLASATTKLARAIGQEDHLRERAERAAEEERDNRHLTLIKLIQGVRDGVETAIANVARDLPEKTVQYVEKKIYELRIARHEAREAGVSNEPAPLMPPPMVREPTGKILVLTGAADEQGMTQGMALTPGQQRGLVELAKIVWKKVWWVLLPAAGAAITKWAHWFSSSPKK